MAAFADDLHHPVVGDLDLSYESFPLAADLSQSLLAYTAEPGSPTQDALTLLANWAGNTTDQSDHDNDERDRELDLHTGSGTDPTTPESAGLND